MWFLEWIRNDRCILYRHLKGNNGYTTMGKANRVRAMLREGKGYERHVRKRDTSVKKTKNRTVVRLDIEQNQNKNFKKGAVVNNVDDTRKEEARQ